MAVTTIPIGVGTIAGDGFGDPARTGGESVNTSVANLDAAVELLQSGKWEISNTTDTLAFGEQRVSTNTAGTITHTCPAVASAPAADSYNHIVIANNDVNGNDIDIAPDGTDAFIYAGVSLGAGVTATLTTGFAVILVRLSASTWNLFEVPLARLTISSLLDVTVTAIASGEVLKWNGSAWINNTLEEADIVDRLLPAIEATPYIAHQSLGSKTGTVTINCEDDPSIYFTVGANNVTIALVVPSLSLPVRGLSAVALRGSVDVLMGGAYSGLTVTTTAGTKLAVFPKGTAPNASGERATLVWKWFDDGTADVMWAEWILEG